MNTINPTKATPDTLSEKIRNPQSPIRNPKVLDTWQIPFPKTLAELHALDATREIPYLKALCNRRQIHTPGKNPTPAEIAPIIQKLLDRHLTLKPKGLSEIADIMVEWKLIHDDFAEFLAQLKNLCPPSSVLSVNSVLIPDRSNNSPHPPRQTSGHSNNSSIAAQKTPAISTNPKQHPKTPGHFNNFPHQNFSSASKIAQTQTPS